mgnify:CR=1 FL=1
MASTGFQILRSSDAGAPTLSGTAGSLISVLDALLDIGGSDAYWAKAFTGTNKAVYRAANGDRYYFRVDDSNAQYADIRGFATMSGVDTGTGQFPTATQQTAWSIIKSATANSTARTYLGIATDRFCLLLVNGGWTGSGQELYCFGEIIKANSADAGASVAKAYPATSTLGTTGFTVGSDISVAFTNYVSGYSVPANNSSAMMPFAKNTDNSAAAGAGKYFGSQPTSSVRVGTYAEIQLIPLYVGGSVSSSAGKLRGRLPHVFVTFNDGGDTGLAVGDTFSDENGATYQLAFPTGTTVVGATYPYLAIMTSNSERAGM